MLIDDRFQGQPWFALPLCYLLLTGTHLAVAEEGTRADPRPPAEPQAPTAPAPEQAAPRASETDQDRPSSPAPPPKPAPTGLCDGS
jgi:hypothetical protein